MVLMKRKPQGKLLEIIKDQKLVDRFLKNGYYIGFNIAVPLQIFGNFH